MNNVLSAFSADPKH